MTKGERQWGDGGRAVTHILAGNGPVHAWTCPPCMREATARTVYRVMRNPHRVGTKARVRFDERQSRIDWAQDKRSETYWSA